MGILELLDSGNYLTYNRAVARHLGSVNAAIMLSELVNRYNYHADNNELKTYKKYEGTWFYYTVEKCELRTVLSRKEQETAVKILEKHCLFEKRSIGIPPKRHFRLDLKAIEKFISGLKKPLIKPEKGAMNGPKGAERDDPKGLNNKEPHKSSNKNNNPPTPQAPNPEPPIKNAARAVVVFPIFEDLEIPDDLKIKLSQQVDEDKASKLVSRVKRWTKRASDSVACHTILNQWDTWEDKLSKEEVVEDNKAWTSRNLKKYDDKAIGNYRCMILAKLVEFCSSGNAPAVCYNYEDADFKDKVTSFMRNNLK